MSKLSQKVTAHDCLGAASCLIRQEPTPTNVVSRNGALRQKQFAISGEGKLLQLTFRTLIKRN